MRLHWRAVVGIDVHGATVALWTPIEVWYSQQAHQCKRPSWVSAGPVVHSARTREMKGRLPHQ